MGGTPPGPEDPTVPMAGGGDPGGPPPAEDAAQDPWYAKPAVFIPLVLVIVLVAVLLVTTLGSDGEEVADPPAPTPTDAPTDDAADPDEPEPADDPPADGDPDEDPDDDPVTDPTADPGDEPPDDEREAPAELGETTSEFVVDLSWENELDDQADPPQFRQGQEGVTGTAWLWLDADEGIICATIVVEGLDPSDSFADGPGAHLHVGGMDENGPIAVPFDAPDDDTGESSGCYTEFEEGVDPVETLRMVEEDPADWYVNVHSAAYPMGVARGQLPDGGQDELPAP